MFRRPIKEISAEFPAEEKYLDSIQRTVKESCAAASIRKKDISAIMLAIEEGATNIIRHAYLYEKGIIRLRIIIYKKLIVFSLIDFGRSFKPNQSGTLDLKHLIESGRKGGLGFYMIQKIMSSVEYISTAAFNELRMVKRIKQGESGSRPLFRRMFTLRVKFSLLTFVIMTIIIGGSLYYFDLKMKNAVYQNLDDTVKSLGTTIADQAAGYILNNRSDVEFDEMIVSYKRANPELIQIVLTDVNNIIRVQSDLLVDIRTLYQPPDNINPLDYYIPQDAVNDGKHSHFLVVPIKIGERLAGRVYLTYSTALISEQLRSVSNTILILTIISIIFGIVGIYILSSTFVSPILKITHRVRKFTSGDLETELPLEGAEEFFEISKAFNQMITRLSQDQKNLVEREKMAKEIEVASEIQKTLLPDKLPSMPNLEIDSFYRAASIIGGDLYDVFKVDDDRYCIAVADVSGKGVPASLVMSMLRTVFRIFSEKVESAGEILIKIDDYLRGNIPPGIFITVFLALYDCRTNKMHMVSAGHNPMLYFKAESNEMIRINPKGMPLGIPVIKPGAFAEKLEEIEVDVRPNDLFLMFTDGISEAVGRDGEQFGLERLEKLLYDHTNLQEPPTLSHIKDEITSRLNDYTGFSRPTDDITFIIGRSSLQKTELKTEMKKPASKVDTKRIDQIDS